MFKIGEFSRLGRVSIKSLRYYDEIGLLQPALVDRQNGYRYYSVKQLPLLNRLVAYRNLGFSLEQSRMLLQDDIPADQMHGLLKVRRAELASAIKVNLEQLNEVEARISEIERHGEAPRYEVVLRSVESRSALSVRRTIATYDGVDGLLAEIQDTIGDASAVEGYGAIWHRCGRADSVIECEAFAVVKDPVPPQIRSAVSHLPAASMACVVHEELDDLPAVCLAVSGRARLLGYEISGPIHETYFPAGQGAFAVTEIQFPVRAVPGFDRIPHNN